MRDERGMGKMKDKNGGREIMEEMWGQVEVKPGGRREKLNLTNDKIRMFLGKKNRKKDR